MKVYATILIATVAATFQTDQTWAASAPPGRISGTVKGSDGTIIASGLVIAAGTFDKQNLRFANNSARAPIKPDGTFTLPPLDRGAYRICVWTDAGPWLDPCEWGSNGVAVSISPSQPSPSVSIVLSKGALVPIRVNDPQQLLPANEGKMPGAHLLMSVTTDAAFSRRAGVASQDSAGRNYQVLIPFDRTVQLSVASSFFQIADATSKALPKSSLTPLLVPSGQQPHTLVLTLSGVH